MTAFLQQYISPALPVILWLFRGVTAGLAVWLLVRCCKSLFRGPGPGELGLCDPV